MSPEDLQGQVARSAAVERELREEIGKLRAELAEAKKAAARTCYQGGTAAGEVLAKMQAEIDRLHADGRLRLSAAEREALARHAGELLQTFGPDPLESEEGRRQIERDRKNLSSAVKKLRAASDSTALRQPAGRRSDG